jgi:ribosomal protein S12 methylthiotransferase accessory factor YcaO
MMFSLYYNNSTHFPICNTYHASMRYPTRIKLFANNALSTPRTIGVDGVMSYGGGTGKGLDLPRKAFGEYFERNHFFTSIPVTSIHTLAEVKSDKLRAKLANCLNQIKFSDQDPLDHEFSFTHVKNLITGHDAEYFYNAVSLNGAKSDGYFYNFNDSCSCAVHITKEKALENSLLEFLERQALVGSWVSSTYSYAINSNILREISPYTELVENFLKNGEIYIFENGVNLPGYSTIMFYFARSKDDMVQYSVGSSAGMSLAEALNSSFEELWQCYLFQYNAENSKGLEDRSGSGYHLSFQKCNHAGIRDIIPFLSKDSDICYEIDTIDDIKQKPIYSFDQVVSELADISSDIFYYHHYEAALGLHYSKIVSPDFFAHMALEQRLNLINNYSQSLNITKENAYVEKIPFP